MFYLAGISIAFFLAVLLFSKRNKTIADKILATWLVVIGLHLVLFYSVVSGMAFEHPWLLGLQFPIPLLHGPFLYLYAATLMGRLKTLGKAEVLHFIPALLSYTYLVHFFMLPGEEKIFIFKHNGVGYELFMKTSLVAIILSGISYVILTALLLRKHRKNILDQYSSTEKVNLDWIQYLIYGIALIWVFVIFTHDETIFAAATCFVLFIGYFGIRQVGIFTYSNPPSGGVAIIEEALGDHTDEQPEEIIELTTTDDPDPKLPENPSPGIETVLYPISTGRKKYSKSGLSEESADHLHRKLKQAVEKDRIFSESELTLTELARKLGTHPNYLSQLINEREGKNFYDYINTLRTEEFKRVVSDPGSRKFTLLGLAYECGFNSKSSFNKYFRKVTGLSPSQYLKQHNIEEAA